jgi:hypothetical protein
MAVPQLQLANLGEIYAQNQAKQAAMDTMQLEQAAAVEKMRQDQLARQKQAQLLEMAKTVDISTPEGAKQAFQSGLLDLGAYQDVQKAASDMALAKQRTETARIQGQTSQGRLEVEQRKAEIYERKAYADMRNQAAQLGISAQNAETARLQAIREYGNDRTELLGRTAFNLMQQPAAQRPAYYQAFRQQAIQSGQFDPEDLPEQYDEATVAGTALWAKPQGKGGTVTLPDGTVIESGGFSNEQKLRKEFLDQSKNFIDVRDSYSRLQAVAADPSPAGDISIIFSYMKMLDPASVVREGEQATAQNAAGISDQIRNLYNKVITGERLSPNQRADFVRQGQKLYEQALGQVQKNAKMYEDIAQKSGLNPALAVPDIGIAAQPAPAGGGQGGVPTLSPAEASQLPSGSKFYGSDGVLRIKQ